MKGVIPAAGKGTRMGDLTADRPKGLVEVANKPILSYVFESLVDIGVEETIVIVGYEGGAIMDYFGEAFGGVPIQYVHQREREGLAAAVLLTEPYIEDKFIVLNGDNIFVDEISHSIDQLRSSKADAGLVVEEVPKSAAGKTGVVRTANSEVTKITEKPKEPDSNLVTTGCYLLPPEIFDACRLLEPSRSGEFELSEAVNLLVKAGKKVTAVEFEGNRLNVNSLEEIEKAEELLSSAQS